MKRQSFTIGARIKQFDNLEVQTVETFNALFPDCPIKNECPVSSVEILQPAPDTSRVILVGGVERVHRMYENLLYNVERSMYNIEEEMDELMGYPV